MREIAGGVCAAKGFSAGGVHCGIRKNQGKKDLSLGNTAQKKVPNTAKCDIINLWINR